MRRSLPDHETTRRSEERIVSEVGLLEAPWICG